MGLDTVELIIGWEQTFGVSIDEEPARAMRTTGDVVDHLYAKLKDDRPEDEGCLAVRAFFRLRNAFRAAGYTHVAIAPATKVSHVLTGRDRRDQLNAILLRVGFTPLPSLPFGLQFTAGTIGDLVLDAVVRHHSALRRPGCGWSRRQVREVARAVMTALFNLRKFSDKAHITRDLGLD
jgi:hypothetical protein